MPRPATTADLPASTLKGEQIASIDMRELPPTPALLTALGAFMRAVAANGLTVTKEYGTVYVHQAPTADALDAALTEAQRDWDEAAAQYDAATISDTRPEDYTRYRIEAFARKEGKPLPWEL